MKYGFFRRILALASTLCLAASPVLAQRIDTTIKVNPDKAITTGSGVFEGWGTSLCWWANRLGYSDTLAQLAADAVFGPDGLHLNIMRYNIGGGDDPSHRHITRTDSAVPGWLYWNEDTQTYFYDYTADARQINVMQRAVKAAGEDALVEVFSNSPPYFMTESGCSSGAEKASENNLREDCVEDFAEYLAHVTAYIKNDLGMPVVSLSPMNEPNTDYWKAYSNKQEGCHVDAGKSQSAILEAAADAMARYSLDDVLLAASDETNPKLQAEAYKSYSAKAKQALGRVNTHTYSDSGARALSKLVAMDGMNLWMSEVDGAGTAGKKAGEMGAALWLGQKIISDITALSPSAWVMWQVIDSHISSEGYHGNRDTGMVDVSEGFWGTAVADHDQEALVLTQKYYGFGQFTRYIRPGSRIIPCNKDALAAYNANTQTLTVVLLNPSDRDKTLALDLSAFALQAGCVQAVRTSGSMATGEHWAPVEGITAADNRVIAPLKANSITTLIIDCLLPDA
ncbi:MAG: hypothetical protein E7321_09370 [Clostridiales bacterium]|nr:hypothetical protein [Clostridiales bacterium]